MTGRPATPTAVHEASGAYVINPQRRRVNEPVNIPDIGDPPDGLNEGELKAWQYIVARCPFGVLGNCDEVTVEICARLLAELWARTLDREKEKGGVDRSGTQQLIAVLSKLGMTPVDRAKVTVLKRERVADPSESYFANNRPN